MVSSAAGAADGEAGGALGNSAHATPGVVKAVSEAGGNSDEAL